MGSLPGGGITPQPQPSCVDNSNFCVQYGLSSLSEVLDHPSMVCLTTLANKESRLVHMDMYTKDTQNSFKLI